MVIFSHPYLRAIAVYSFSHRSSAFNHCRPPSHSRAPLDFIDCKFVTLLSDLHGYRPSRFTAQTTDLRFFSEVQRHSAHCFIIFARHRAKRCYFKPWKTLLSRETLLPFPRAFSFFFAKNRIIVCRMTAVTGRFRNKMQLMRSPGKFNLCKFNL